MSHDEKGGNSMIWIQNQTNSNQKKNESPTASELVVEKDDISENKGSLVTLIHEHHNSYQHGAKNLSQMSLNSNAHKNQKVIVESCASDVLIHDQQNNIQLEQDGNTQITGESPDGENLQIPFPSCSR